MKNKLKKRIIMSTLAIAISIAPVSLPGKLIVANANPSQETINNINQRSAKTGVVKPCDFLNVRSGPSANNSVIGKVYTNDKVNILETHNNGWHKVSTSKGITGWVSGRYITVQNQQTSTQTPAQPSSKVNSVLDVAKKQLGKPYKWGASGPNSFDCSGLVYYSYKNGAGVTLPRTSRDQAKAGKAVSKDKLQPGDLVFFATGGGRTISHVGIYMGDNKFIHATQPGDVMKIANMNSSYYTKTYVTARRVL